MLSTAFDTDFINISLNFHYCKVRSIDNCDKLLAAIDYQSKRVNKWFSGRKQQRQSSRLKSLYRCLVCFDASEEEQFLWTNCPNTYGKSVTGRMIVHRGVCCSCVDEYIFSSIRDAKVTADGSVRCVCPDKFCSTRYDREFITSRLSTHVHPSDNLMEKYERFVLNALVESDSSKVWCPREGCESIVTLTPTERRATCLKCQLSFCAKCVNAHSALVSCSLVLSSLLFSPSSHSLFFPSFVGSR